jgi:methionyl-tRNA formyltransferase
MRIAFFGTPGFAVPSLEMLVETHQAVVLAVTQPDRPRGRSHSNLEPCPVASRAASFVIPVLQPDKPRGETFETALRQANLDLGVVVAYGHLLRPEVLAIPRLGMINVHASLLPAWRGAAPIQWAIAHGDRTTGVTIMQMEAGLDSGPMLLAKETPIGPTETGGDLTRRLGQLGAAALAEAVSRLEAGTVVPIPQDHARATLAPKVGREVARIDWSHPAEAIANLIRAFDPVPAAWTRASTGEFKCFRAAAVEGSGPPGTVLAADRRLLIATGAGAVEIGEVKPAGRSRMAAAAWLRGRSLQLGEVLG